MIDEPRWYCLKTKPRTERGTAALLRADAEVEVFCPLVRFERARRTGKLWVTEAMFPGYIFARFPYPTQHRHVRSIRGVMTIVAFGEIPADVSDEVIGGLREAVQDEETVVIKTPVQPGEEVSVIEGPFRGLRAVVSRVLPARERVAVLLELLGMEREVEVGIDSVIPDVLHPLARSEGK